MASRPTPTARKAQDIVHCLSRDPLLTGTVRWKFICADVTSARYATLRVPDVEASNVKLRTIRVVIVRAAGSRRPSKRTAPSSAGVRSGLAVIRSRTRNQIATGRSGQPDQDSLVKHFLSIHGCLLGTL